MERRRFDLDSSAFPPIPGNLEGRPMLLMHTVYIAPDGHVQHEWYGGVTGDDHVSTTIGSEQETPEAVLSFLSDKLAQWLEVHKKSEALPQEIHDAMFTHDKELILKWLETPGRRKIRANPELAAQFRDYLQAREAFFA